MTEFTNEELQYLVDDTEVTVETFTIADDKTAEWALRKIKEEQDEYDRLEELARLEISEIEFKIEKAAKRLDSNTSYLKMLLNQYFAKVPHKSTKTQETYKLLSGSLIMKKPSQKINHDDDALIKFFGPDETFVKTKKTVDWVEYKKHLIIEGDKVIDTDTGEVVGACSVEDIPAKFDVKF